MRRQLAAGPGRRPRPAPGPRCPVRGGERLAPTQRRPAAAAAPAAPVPAGRAPDPPLASAPAASVSASVRVRPAAGRVRPGRRISAVPAAGRQSRAGSERVVPALAGADPDDLVDRRHPDLAVADLAGARRPRRWRRRPRRRRSRRRRTSIRTLGTKSTCVLRAPVDLGVPALPAVALDLADGQPGTPERSSAFLTSSSLNGLTIAVTSFMRRTSFRCCGPRRAPAPTSDAPLPAPPPSVVKS